MWRGLLVLAGLNEEFALSVSDDTVYRTLKELGYSHISAGPKADKKNAGGNRSSPPALAAAGGDGGQISQLPFDCFARNDDGQMPVR